MKYRKSETQPVWNKTFFSLCQLKLGFILSRTSKTGTKNTSVVCFLNSVDDYFRKQLFRMSKLGIYSQHHTFKKYHRVSDFHSICDPQLYFCVKHDLDFSPCDEDTAQLTRPAAFVLDRAAGKLYAPPNFYLFSNQRVAFAVAISENTLFHINLTFTQFSYEYNLRCFTDFVNLETSDKDKNGHKTPEYVYCGRRPPWTVVYTFHNVFVYSVARRTSHFTLAYQVTNSGFISTFHDCQYLQCQENIKCKSFVLEQSKTIYYVQLIGEKLSVHIHFVHVVIRKFQKLQVTLKGYSNLQLYDGPSLENKRVQLNVSHTKLYTLSSFQAVLVTEQVSQIFIDLLIEYITKYQQPKISFKNNLEFNTSSPVNTLHFNVRCTGHNCIVFKRMYIKQPHNFSHNITIDYVHATRYQDNKGTFGGISVYLFDEKNSVEEVFCVSHNLSRDTNKLLSDRTSRYSVITNISTKYIIFVYHYYSIFTFVKGKINISRTYCNGIYIPIKPCGEHFTISINQRPICQSKKCETDQSIFYRPKNRCIVITLFTKTKATVEFAKRVVMRGRFFKQNFCKGLKNLMVFYDNNEVPRILHLEIYMLHFSFVTEANYILTDSTMTGEPDFHAKGRLSQNQTGPQIVFKRHCSAVPIENMSFTEQEYSSEIRIDNHFQSKKFHLKIRTAAMARKYDMLSFDKSIKALSNNGWGVLFIQFTNCHYPQTYLFPGITSSDNSSCSLEDNAAKWDAVSETHRRIILDLEWSVVKGKRSNLLAEVQTLNQKFERHISSFHLQSNLSQNEQNGFVRIMMNAVLKFEYVVPVGEVDVYFPVMALPRCDEIHYDNAYYCGMMGCCVFKISISSSLIAQMNKIHVYHPANTHRKVENKFGLIHPVCYQNICSLAFVSWNQARKMCVEKEMELPSVHSTQDMARIKEQVDQHDCLFSQPDLIYETMALYIGLNSEVGCCSSLFLASSTQQFKKLFPPTVA